LLDAQGGVSDRPPDYLQAFGFGNYWAVDSSQLDYLLMAKPVKLSAARSGKAAFIPPIRKNLAEVLWLIGQEALASGLGRPQRLSGGSLLGANIAPDFRRRASLRWLRCNRTALRPCQDRVVGGALDALPAEAGSASAAAILKDKASIAAIFRSP
jgi:hypothetical protein